MNGLTTDYIYISGKIAGNANYREDFARAEKILLDLGWPFSKIINPVTDCERLGIKTWTACVARCVDIFPKTGTLCRLSSWKWSSVGCAVENELAKQRGLVICDLVGNTLKLADDYLTAKAGKER